MEHTAIRIEELDVEQAQLLPEREALSNFNWAGIVANNTALAVNAATVASLAAAFASQSIEVHQS
jgi:hypothetical protein